LIFAIGFALLRPELQVMIPLIPVPQAKSLSTAKAAGLPACDPIVAISPAPPLPADAQLRRVIGPWGLVANAINGAIGGAIFAMPGLVAAILGPAAILAYLVCGLAIALVLTCFAEMGSVVHRSGGCVAYIEEAFGPLAGFLAWIAYTLGYEIVGSAALAALLLDSAATVVPSLSHGLPRICALFALFGSLAIVNIRGVRESIRLTVISTIAKLLPLVFLICAGVFFMHRGNFHVAAAPSFGNLGQGALLIFFAFQGLEEALAPGAEFRNPRRTVPLAIFYAAAALILLYVAIQLVAQGILGAELGRSLTAPLADAGAVIAGSPGRELVILGVSISIFGSIVTGIICAPRAFFLMAQDTLLPSSLARVHRRFHTPHISILVATAIMFLLSATGAFSHLAMLSVSATLLVYLAICVGALRLRYTRPRLSGSFRARGGPTIALLGTGVVLWLLASTSQSNFAVLGGMLLLATLYFFLVRRLNSRTSLQA
jgi:basic amino acid/polyamine antiporter, APA family